MNKRVPNHDQTDEKTGIELANKPYVKRRTTPLDVREIAGWRLKLYGISVDGEEIPEAVWAAASTFALENVNWPQHNGLRTGFLTIHRGEQAVWLLVDIWVEDILRHFLFSAPTSAPTIFSPVPSDGTMACVWELEVIKHERDAWVRHVLSKPDCPDLAGYFGDRLEIKQAVTGLCPNILF